VYTCCKCDRRNNGTPNKYGNAATNKGTRRDAPSILRLSGSRLGELNEIITSPRDVAVADARDCLESVGVHNMIIPGRRGCGSCRRNRRRGEARSGGLKSSRRRGITRIRFARPQIATSARARTPDSITANCRFYLFTRVHANLFTLALAFPCPAGELSELRRRHARRVSTVHACRNILRNFQRVSLRHVNGHPEPQLGEGELGGCLGKLGANRKTPLRGICKQDICLESKSLRIVQSNSFRTLEEI